MTPLNECKFSEEQVKFINKQVLQSFDNYKKSLSFMACDAPIGVLCLPKVIEKILISNDIYRVYNLIDLDLTKIKRLGAIRRRQLTSCLNQFLAMC